jgi:AcrR family transcriptional regulator
VINRTESRASGAPRKSAGEGNLRRTQRSSGMRQRKKERTREDLVVVACRLFTERGYEETSVDDIVDVVCVSKRTFFRYFQSKDDVLVAWVDRFIDQVCELLEARPPDEKPFESLERALVGAVESFETDLPQLFSMERMIARTPAILEKKLVRLHYGAERMSKILAKRLRGDIRREPVHEILAQCGLAILEAAVARWRAQGGRGRLAETLANCFHRTHIDVT